MTLMKSEIRYFLRSPIIWLILAISAFVSAWFFLLSIDIFTSLQIKFANMSDAPTILAGVVYPIIAAQGKLFMVIIAIVGGLSFARLSDSNAWSLLAATQYSEFKIIVHKYVALLFIISIFLLPTLLAIVALLSMTQIAVLPVILAIVGLLLLLMWMLAVAMYISSLVNNSGFAILLCLIFFMLMWLLSQSGLDASWGKNWLQTLSPFYHFKQFLSDYLSLASVIYLLGGILLLLWALQIRLIHKRFIL